MHVDFVTAYPQIPHPITTESGSLKDRHHHPVTLQILQRRLETYAKVLISDLTVENVSHGKTDRLLLFE